MMSRLTHVQKQSTKQICLNGQLIFVMMVLIMLLLKKTVLKRPTKCFTFPTPQQVPHTVLQCLGSVIQLHMRLPVSTLFILRQRLPNLFIIYHRLPVAKTVSIHGCKMPRGVLHLPIQGNLLPVAHLFIMIPVILSTRLTIHRHQLSGGNLFTLTRQLLMAVVLPRVQGVLILPLSRQEVQSPWEED